MRGHIFNRKRVANHIFVLDEFRGNSEIEQQANNDDEFL